MIADFAKEFDKRIAKVPDGGLVKALQSLVTPHTHTPKVPRMLVLLAGAIFVLLCVAVALMLQLINQHDRWLGLIAIIPLSGLFIIWAIIKGRYISSDERNVAQFDVPLLRLALEYLRESEVLHLEPSRIEMKRNRFNLPAEVPFIDQSRLFTNLPYRSVTAKATLVLDGQDCNLYEIRCFSDDDKVGLSGVLAQFPMRQVTAGETFVSLDEDQVGYGGRTKSSFIREQAGALITELEWNDFEALLAVSATDPVEARVILTPDVMEELYYWWDRERPVIRISFIKQSMYVFVSNLTITHRLGALNDQNITLHLRRLYVSLAYLFTLHNKLRQKV